MNSRQWQTGGVIDTNDGSLIVSVDRPPGWQGSAWNISGGLLGSDHPFWGEGGNAEDRINIGGRQQFHTVSLGNCSTAISFVKMQAAGKKSPSNTPIALLVRGRSWPAEPLGDLQLAENFSLSDVLIGYDGRDFLHMSGRLLLDGARPSRDVVDVRIAQRNGQVSLARPVAFDIPAPNPDWRLPPLMLERCCGEDRNHPVVARLNLADESIETTAHLKLGGETQVPLMYSPTGTFSWSGRQNVSWYNQRRSTATIREFTINPAGVKDSSGNLQYLTVSGDAHLGGTDDLLLTGFALMRTSLGMEPEATFKLKKFPQQDWLTIHQIDGTFDEQGKVVMNVSAKVSVPFLLPPDDPSPGTARRGATPVPMNAPTAVPLLSVEMSGIRAVANSTAPDDLDNAASWALDFSKAVIQTGEENGTLYGHQVVPCDSKTLTQLKLTPTDPKMALCLGVRLDTSKTDDKDVVYGFVDLCYGGALPENSQAGCGEQGQVPRLQVSRFRAKLADNATAPLRLGIAKFDLSSVELDLTQTAHAFEKDIPSDILTALHCDNIAVVGSVTVSSATVPGLTASVMSSGQEQVPTTPRIGFGNGCVVFAMEGMLPIQLTPQSSLVLTSLVYAHSHQGAGSDLNYIHAAGAATSGTVTVAFKSLGVRTLNGSSSDTCNSKQYHETKYGGVCVVSDVNWPLTTALTGAQNADAIGKALASLASFGLGLAIGHH